MLSNAPRVLLSGLALGVVVAAVAATSSGTAHATGPTTTATATTSTTTSTPTSTTIDHTVRRAVRPVTAAGVPTARFTVRRESGSVTCADQSPAAYDARIDTCYPSAYYLPSCWRSANHTVLCLRHVSDRRLVRIRYSGAFAAGPALRHRSPQGLTLLGGATCDLRIGGAWGSPPSHPDWVGWYSCTNGSVYGPATGDGIDRSQPVWRVHILRSDGTMVTRRVAKATYVGDAR